MPTNLFRKMQPHLYKDMRILYRETQVLLVLIMPVMYAGLYLLLSKDPREVAKICFGLTLSFCPLFIQAMLIVSDKESGEMQTLMRAGASLKLILASKALTACAATLAAWIVCVLLLLLFPLRELALLALYMLPLLLAFLSLGTLLGFWYHTMQDVVVGKGFTSILLVLLIILPILASASPFRWVQAVYGYYPTGLLTAAIEAVGEPGAQVELLRLLAVSWLWAAVLFGFVVRLYKREMTKEG